MFDITFLSENTRLVASAIFGIALLLALIIKFKIHPVLSLLVASLTIGLGSGLEIPILTAAVNKGAGQTLQGVVLLVGLGAMLGGILEASGGAQSVAKALVQRFGDKKAGIALGLTGIVVGSVVYFEAAVMVIMPIAFSLARKSKQSVLVYALPILAGLASAFVFIPPSTGSVLVANLLGANLGLVIAVGIPTAILSTLTAGILWSTVIGHRVMVMPPVSEDVENESVGKLPDFKHVLCIIAIPFVLILLSTLTQYVSFTPVICAFVQLLGTPFVALIVTIFVAMRVLGRTQGYTIAQMRDIFDRALRPTASILLVIAGSGIISEVLQTSGVGNLIRSVMEHAELPLILSAFLFAALIRITVGVGIVPMTMASGMMCAMPGFTEFPPLQVVALLIAINSGATLCSHVNDSGFWMVSSVLKMSEKDTLMTWTVLETIIGFTGLAVALILSQV